jgi:hypothetical protein
VLRQQLAVEQEIGTRDVTATDQHWKTKVRDLETAQKKQLAELRCVHLPVY